MIKDYKVNVRTMLLDLGVDSFLADIAIPFAWFSPGAVDPDSPSIIEINKAMQRGFRKLGYGNVRVNGILDRQTAAALDEISGPGWMSKAFVQIFGDILAAMKDPERKANQIKATKGLGAYFHYEGIPPGPLPSFRAGTPPGPLGMYQDLGALTFGQGISNKNNIVPIPKNSGETYEAFKNLQRQINRLLTKHPKGGKIGEDGIIGKSTFDALKKAQDVIGMSVPGDETTLTMAQNADSIGDILRQRADAMGIPGGANKGTTATPAAALEKTSGQMTPQQASVYGAPGTAMEAVKKYAPFLAIAAGVAYYAATKKKKKGRK